MALSEQELKTIDELLLVASKTNGYGSLPDEYWAGNHPHKDIILKSCAELGLFYPKGGAYHLTDFGKEVLREGGYSFYLINKSIKENRDIDTLEYSKKAFIWSRRNTIWLTILSIIAIITSILVSLPKEVLTKILPPNF